jgi:hypothetical protein
MGKKEYRLKDTEDKLDKEDFEQLEGVLKKVTVHIKLSNSEAASLGRFIILPQKPEIDYLSLMEIKPINKTKIDPIEKLPNKELQEWLREYQKRNKTSKKSIREIVNQFNKIQKSLDNDERQIDNLQCILENTTEKVVKNKHIDEYVNKLEMNCDKLIDSLFLEQIELLDLNTKNEILSKIGLLESYIIDFKKQLSI